MRTTNNAPCQPDSIQAGWCLTVAWTRTGDTAAHHPLVLRPLEFEECDDRLVNELYGFAHRCATLSGAHTTDYIVSRGTAIQVGGSFARANELIRLAIRAGYMTQVEVDGAIAYKLIDDDHDFLHLRTKEEIEWEKQQRRDNNNPAITVPVRLRDGDACRWCGKVVDWDVKTGARGGTYDHLIPGRGATVETSVVACRSCNSSRGKGDGVEWQDREPLPVPAEPYFSAATIDRLKKNRWAKDHGYEVPARTRKTVSPGDPAPYMAANSTSQSPAPAASTAPAGERPDNQSETAGTPDPSDAPAQRTDPESANALSNTRTDAPSANASKPDSNSENDCLTRNVQEPASNEGMALVVPGRDGTGLDGSGRVGSGAPLLQNPPSESPSARNSSRGRRRRKRGRGTQSQNRSSGDPRG